MLGESGIPDQHSVVLEHRDVIADHLGGFGWNHGANYLTNMGERAASRFRNFGEIFVYCFRNLITSHAVLLITRTADALVRDSKIHGCRDGSFSFLASGWLCFFSA